jgi:hypothetical protein
VPSGLVIVVQQRFHLPSWLLLHVVADVDVVPSEPGFTAEAVLDTATAPKKRLAVTAVMSPRFLSRFIEVPVVEGLWLSAWQPWWRS